MLESIGVKERGVCAHATLPYFLSSLPPTFPHPGAEWKVTWASHWASHTPFHLHDMPTLEASFCEYYEGPHSNTSQRFSQKGCGIGSSQAGCANWGTLLACEPQHPLRSGGKGLAHSRYSNNASSSFFPAGENAGCPRSATSAGNCGESDASLGWAPRNLMTNSVPPCLPSELHLGVMTPVG